MKKSLIALIVVGAACAGLYWKHNETKQDLSVTAQSEAAGERAKRVSSRGLPPPVEQAPPESERADEAEAETATPPVELTAGELAVVGMYDAMVKALDSNAADCAAMARSVVELTKVHADEVQRWSAEQEKLDEAHRQQAQSRVQAVARVTIEQLGQSLRRGLSTCGTNESLLAAVGQLSVLSGRP